MKYNSVWDAIEDDPLKAEDMKLRSFLMMVIKQSIQDEKINYEQAADILGISQDRIDSLVQGKINEFTLEVLLELAKKLQLDFFIPNKETIQAMRDAQAGEVETFDTVDDLFTDAGLTLKKSLTGFQKMK